MAFGKAKNRRRADAAQVAASRKAAFSGAWKLLRAATLTVLLCAALFFGGRYGHQWAMTSPYFALKTLTITGAARAEQPDLQKLGGLFPGQNLWQLDVDAVRKSLAAHPWVKSVEVERHFPSTVSVKISEHHPVAMVALGELYLLDEDGEPFKRVVPADDLDLPLVTGVDREAYVANAEETSARLRQALAAAASYAASPVGQRLHLSEVRVAPEGVVLVTGEGQELRMGAGEVGPKLAQLEKVNAELLRRGLSAQVIHLDNRARPGWVAVQLSTPVSERRTGSTK
jgi:cell division protein FtsQ